MSNDLSREDLILAYDLAGDILELGSSASLDRSPKKNWVENAGNLPPYVREVARSIEKTGKTLSQAIAIAISRIKKWAVSGTAETKAKAIKALAQWEALKAKNKGKKAAKAAKSDVKATAINRMVENAVVLELSTAVHQDAVMESILELSVLTAKGRKHIKESNFAIPEDKKYPIHDEAHARNALARVAQHGTPEEQRRVRAAVKKKYPHLVKDDGKD